MTTPSTSTTTSMSIPTTTAIADPLEHTFDVVVVGSGSAAFATAIGAAESGLTVIMLESTDKWGGSSAMSGGGQWLPTNPLMARDGAGDSREEALTYLEETVGDEGRATSRGAALSRGGGGTTPGSPPTAPAAPRAAP